MKKLIGILSKQFVYWILFFAFFRLIFLILNRSYGVDVPIQTQLASFFYGFRLDLAIAGYIIAFFILIQLISLIVVKQYSYKLHAVLQTVFISIVTVILYVDTILYSYWAKHIDSEAISFLDRPFFILNSLRWFEIVIYPLIILFIIYLAQWIFNRWFFCKVKSSRKIYNSKSRLIYTAWGLLLLVLMILPIRGSFGVAPINTGVAYFSDYQFANQAAINPVFNLGYSYKRHNELLYTYAFMDNEKAIELYKQLRAKNDTITPVLKTNRPNIVFILLESFSSQTIERLGGEAVTPELNKLIPEGIFFDQVYSASNRSDKGITAAIAGYQVLPTYSIIQYPQKTQHLAFMPRKLIEAGYNDLTFMYGGDIKFKNMNSFAVQAGFKKIISIDDFPRSERGEKWGVHDEFTFHRLIEEMKTAKQPFLQFYFTLSSHEPFIVPMDRMFADDYYNSIAYTDKWLGWFFQEVKKEGLWDNTLFVLMADHGVTGPKKLMQNMKSFNHIPLLWTGGALAVSDTIVSKIGCQTDVVSTLLNQLSIADDSFVYSKNLLNPSVKGYAFYTFNDGFGFIDENHFQIFNTQLNKFMEFEGDSTDNVMLEGKAILQLLSIDHKNK